jgi:hypothetical protein
MALMLINPTLTTLLPLIPRVVLPGCDPTPLITLIFSSPFIHFFCFHFLFSNVSFLFPLVIGRQFASIFIGYSATGGT